MYAIYTQGETYSSLTEQEFITIRSMLQHNRVPYRWVHTNI